MRVYSRMSKFSWIAVALVVAVFVIAACGSNNNTVDDSGAVVGTDATAAPAVVEPVATATPDLTAGSVESGTVTGTNTDTESTIITETAVMTDVGSVAIVTSTEVITEMQVITDTQVATDTNVMVEGAIPAGAEVVSDTGAMNETTDTAMTTTTGTTAATNMQAGSSAMQITGITGAEGALIRASTLLDYDFDNRDGNVSGNLKDLLVDVSNGQILFASIEYGGFLDIGDKEIVIPLSAFTLSADNRLVLNFDEQVLQDFPGLGDNWPNISDPTWDNQVNDFWRNNNFDTGYNFDATNSANVMWLSDMTGLSIADNGTGVSTIDDALVDMGASKIKYIVFSDGTGLGTNEAYVVPYSALDVQNASNGNLAFNNNVTPDMLSAAPRYNRTQYDNTDIMPQNFNTDMNTYWGDNGYATD